MAIHRSETALVFQTVAAGTEISINIGEDVASIAKYIEMPGYSVHAQWGSGGVGTIKIQGRIGQELDWIDLTDTEQAISAAGGYMWNLREQHYTEFRVYFTYTSGTLASLVVNYSAKAIY